MEVFYPLISFYVINIFVLHTHLGCSEAWARGANVSSAQHNASVSHSYLYFEAISCLSEFNTSLHVLLMQTDGTNRSFSVCSQRLWTDLISHMNVTNDSH
ncbi:hypothetical protein ILYODFUR_035487 [Ilyodon furcidens]|uniref:Secreted protein n=1 Tax=Ilyodon furcidens TaxID=33524 RepID=A0ABV0U0G6_9TELE